MVKCFGACGFGGSLYSFFNAIDSTTSREKLHNLALITTIDLTNLSFCDNMHNEGQQEELNIQDLIECTEDIDYLKQRSINANTIQKFEIRYNQRMNYIVLPVYNDHGDSVGYIKRNLGHGSKYSNSPDLNVNSILFPMDKVFKTNDKIILVEGVFDAIRAHQEGYVNTLSNLGGKITQKQIKVLGEYTKNVILCFDKDRQGIDIARSNINELNQYGFAVELAIAPGAAKDLAEVSSMYDFITASYSKLRFFNKDIDYLVYKT